MRMVVKPVYYCEYCGKRYLSEYWGDLHEKHCTLNPNRDCRMCDYFGTANNIVDILNNIYDETQDSKLYPTAQKILEITDGCPQCTLTIMRLLKTQKRFEYLLDPDGSHDIWFEWDYKKACDEFWREYNNEMAKHDYYYYY